MAGAVHGRKTLAKKVSGTGISRKETSSAEEELAQNKEPQESEGPLPVFSPGGIDSRSLNRSSIIALQHTVGNQAVQRLISGRKSAAPRAIQRDDDFVYDSKYVNSNRQSSTSSPKAVDGGTQTGSSITDTAGVQWNSQTNPSQPNTSKSVFLGSTNSDSKTSLDVTGKTTTSHDEFSGGKWNTTDKDPNDKTHSTSKDIVSGQSSSSSETTEKNSRDLVLGHSTSSSSSSGYSNTTTDTRGTGTSKEVNKNETFIGKESSSNLSQNLSLNSAKVSGGMDTFEGERQKKSYKKGEDRTNTRGNQADTGLGVADSLLGNKAFLKETGLDQTRLHKYLKSKEVKDKVLHEKGTAVTHADTHPVPPGAAAELLFQLRDALQTKDLAKRLEAVKKIEDEITKQKNHKAVSMLAKEFLGTYENPLGKWIWSGDPQQVHQPDEIIKNLDLVIKNSGLVTKAGKSKDAFESETVKGFHTKTTKNVKAGIGGGGATIANSTKLGFYDNRSKTNRGNLGKLETENVLNNEFMAGARLEGSAGFKLSPSNLSANLDASAMLGLEDVLTDTSTIGSADGQSKLQNQFKASGLAGAKGSLSAKAKLGASGINLGLDASAFAGLKGSIEDAVEFTYEGHKLFSLKGSLTGSLGVGANASFKLNMGSNGNLVLAFEAGITVGLGGGVAFEIEINFKEIGALLVRKILDGLKWLWAQIKSIGKKLKALFSSKTEDTSKKKEVKELIEQKAHKVLSVAQQVSQIPAKLDPVLKIASNSPDSRPAKAIQKMSSAARNLGGDLKEAKAKLEDAASKDPSDKGQKEEVKEAAKDIKKEVDEANKQLEDIAGN